MGERTNESGAIDRYLSDARSVPALDRDTELELARRAIAGDADARDRLILASLRHVAAIAVGYRRYGIPLADLMSAGNIGLCIAITKFDPERGLRFVTYAGHWVRAQMVELVLRHRSLVGGGAGAFRSRNYFRLQRERSRIEARIADPLERRARLAEALGETETQIDEWLARLDARDVALDAPIDAAHGPGSLLDRLAAGDVDADEQLHARKRDVALDEAVRDALTRLDERERRIVEARGLGEEPMSLADLAREFGVSRERARQLEERAHGKLRKQLGRFVDAAA